MTEATTMKAQLRGDLDLIEAAVNRADAAEPVKRVMREVIEWNRGLVEQLAAQAERVDELEGVVGELLEGSEEGVSVETAQVILTALEQARHVCAAVTAMLEGDKLAVDELTRKRFGDQVRACERSLATASQTVGELVFDEEDDSEGDGEEGDEDEGGDAEQEGDEPEAADAEEAE